MTDSLLVDRDAEGVLLLTLNRPHKKNAMHVELWAALGEAIAAAREDASIAAVVLTGAGSDFCSGTDLTEFGEAGADHPFPSFCRTMNAFDKPLLVAARGIAVGGGATMMLHADVIHVGESLRMRLPFVSLGLVPELASSYLLAQHIGLRRASELFFTAEWIDAARALEVGIATAVVPDQDLLDHTLSRAREMAQWPVSALRETKRLLRRHHGQELELALQAEEASMAELAGKPENVEAVMAFLEKRKPDFSRFR